MTRLQKHMLASDLDGTLLGDASALAGFAHWTAANRDSLSLVYVTGRSFESVVEVVDESPLPEPDAVIAAVGTSIHHYPGGEVVEEWRNRVNDRWNAQAIRRLLRGQEGLKLQEEEFQSEFKVSYYAENVDSPKLGSIDRRLRSAGIDTEIIYSSGRDLDFLPAGMNKGSAVAFLADCWGIRQENVLVSGNKGNDRALFEQGFAGVVVANAEPELKVVRGAKIHHAAFACAAGVMEGIRYFWEL